MTCLCKQDLGQQRIITLSEHKIASFESDIIHQSSNDVYIPCRRLKLSPSEWMTSTKRASDLSRRMELSKSDLK